MTSKVREVDWDALSQLGPGQWRSGSLAEELLAQWARGSGVTAAGVYAGNPDGSWRRRVVVGSAGALPVHLNEMPADDKVRQLPGGLLVLFEGGEGGAVPAELLAAPGEPAIEHLLTAGVHLHELSDELKRQKFEHSFDSVKMQALYDVGLSITSTLDLEELTDSILMHAVSLLDARRGAIYLVEGDEFRLQRSILGDAPASIARDSPEVSRLLEACGSVEANAEGMHYLMAVSIDVEGSPVGLLLVGDKESRTGVGPFTEDDYRSLSLFAAQAAIALENARLHRQALDNERLRREMELAAEIQRGILPHLLPELEGFELLGWNRPAREVGGDYYGAFTLGDDRLAVVVADVTGKGMPAALLVSTIHSALRLMVDRYDDYPDLVARLNQHIAESSSANKFITLILAILDRNSDRLVYINAGHNPGFVVRANGETELLQPSGVPLGLLPMSRYTEASVAFGAGDLLCLYSDGINECEAPNDDQYGFERLVEHMVEHRGEPLADAHRTLEADLGAFARGNSQNDDQTLMLVRRDR